MLHKFFEKGYWFEAKKFGYGSGLPIAWQGWVLLASYVAFVVGMGIAIENSGATGKILAITCMVAATILFGFVGKNRTEGGWRWRP